MPPSPSASATSSGWQSTGTPGSPGAIPRWSGWAGPSTMRVNPPSARAANATDAVIASIPASKARTPAPSRTKYTFMVLTGKPPRTTQTPSAIGSGPLAIILANRGRVRRRPEGAWDMAAQSRVDHHAGGQSQAGSRSRGARAAGRVAAAAAAALAGRPALQRLGAGRRRRHRPRRHRHARARLDGPPRAGAGAGQPQPGPRPAAGLHARALRPLRPG